MNTGDATPPAPDESQRLAARVRPAGNEVMFQQWRDLLFLHWEYPVAAIQATLPEGLFVDTFGGKAYLGVVPFFMRNIRPRFLPAVAGISDFMEMNLRTYVHDRAGVPGVWFYSLDANQWLAVKIARRFFHLPYEHARMTSSRTAEGRIRYESLRTGARANCARCVFDYAPGANVAQPEPRSLEFFLVERYRLYSRAPGGLRRGAVFHPPYPLCRADVTAWDENLLPLDGFAPTGRAPDHVVMSRGVDVTIFPLERLGTM
jgi:uncharacterized protein YqjF (DUF2071 family)